MSSDLVITRELEAPPERVWEVWSDPEKFKKWWGPKLFTCPVSEIDFKVGGKYLHCMHGEIGLPAEMVGKDFWNAGTYKEIVYPDPSNPSGRTKIVMTDSFADPKGKVVPASVYGMKGDFPMEMEVTVEFEGINNGQTKMTLTHRGMPEGDNQDGARMGWNESFDKLEKLVVKVDG